MNRFTLGLLFTVAIASCVKDPETERQVSFHKNGNLKREIYLKNGKRNGVERIYFEGGKLKAIAYWENGKRNGKNSIYYENGKMRQEKYYVDGLICCLNNDYDSAGRLRTVVKFDSLGRIIDFAWFDSLGNRDFRPEHKNALFISQSDTVMLGEVYDAQIKLGNKKLDRILVTIGDLEDRNLLIKTPPLTNKDSVTALFRFRPTTRGVVTITGLVQEKNHEGDTTLITPFEHKIYVKDH